MSTWSALGIERTRDPEAIERAYEYQLRFVDPDTDPDAYRALRRAYEDAMQEAGAAPRMRTSGRKRKMPLPGKWKCHHLRARKLKFTPGR